MSQNSDGWNKSENTTNPDWDFSVNPVIEGTFIQLKEITIAQRVSKLAVIRVQTQQGLVDFGVWLNKVLEGKFEDPGLRIGYLVRIQFMGMAKPKSGGNSYKNFDLFWKAQTVDVTLNQQPTVQVNQQQVMPPVNMNEMPSYASGVPYQQPVSQQQFVTPVPVQQVPPQPVYQQPVVQQFQPPPPPIQNVQPQVQQPVQQFQNVPVQPVGGVPDPRFPQLPPPPAGFKYNEQGQLVNDIPF